MSATWRPVTAGSVLTLAELARVVGGTLHDGAGDAPAASYAIDSRAVVAGTVFFALTGERTDGHRFLPAVAAAGAAAAIVRDQARPDPPLPTGLATLRVADTARALSNLGRHFRHHWPLRVVGITGSAGKTTTKEFTATLLGQRTTVFKSDGNLNTTIGLPLSLTSRRPEQQVAVLELGMSYPGELRRVAAIAAPDVAVITNIGLAHALNFASADDIAKAKAEILEELRPGGTFVANADDPRVAGLAAAFPGRVVTFGSAQPADVRASAIATTGLGTRCTVTIGHASAQVELRLVGRHHVSNVVAALAVAHALGFDALELAAHVVHLGASQHRGALLRLAGDILLLDDCYNSNPAATASALDGLHTMPGQRRIAVLGDMLELGRYAVEAHRQIGTHAARTADLLIAVGPESADMAAAARTSGMSAVVHVDDAEGARQVLLAAVADHDAILVKGSRGIGLELVVDALRAVRPEQRSEDLPGRSPGVVDNL